MVLFGDRYWSKFLISYVKIKHFKGLDDSLIKTNSEMFHLLIYCPNAGNSWGWADRRQLSRIQVGSPTWWQQTQPAEPSADASQGIH